MKKSSITLFFIASLLATQALALPDPVGWWKLDEGTGTNIFDSSGNGNNGVLEGGSLSSCWISGVFSNALKFGGVTTNWVTIPYSPTLVPTQSFTLTAWVRTPTNNEFDIENWDASNNGNYLLEVFPQGAIFWLASNGADIPYPPPLQSANWATNSWHHFAGVYTGTNALLYVDGVFAGTMVATGGISAVQNPLIFGWPDPLYDQGAADDVRIYDRALSSNDVVVLYSFSLGDTVGDGIPNWWRQQYFSHGGSTNGTSCASCDPDGDGFSNLQEYNLGADPTNAVSHPTVIPANLAGWWKFDEGAGTNISDSSFNGNNGVLEGGSLSSCWTAGVLGSALTFGGVTTNWVTIPYNPSLVPTQSFTLAAWVKPPTNNEFAIENWDANNNGNYLLEVFPDRATFWLSLNDNNIYSPSFTTNTWHHFVGVYTGTNALLYIDGALVGTTVETGRVSALQNPLVFGWPDPQFDQGTADDIRLYNRALSSNDVVVLFNSYNFDTVGDGIPNWWRQQYFGSAITTNASSCASCDPDNDGYSNLQEYNLSTDPTNSASYPSSIPANLVGWWKFDEGSGTNIFDSSLNGHDGLLKGNSPSSCWTSGVSSSALSFGGAMTNWVQIPYVDSLTPTQALTVTAWVKMRSTTNVFTLGNWDPAGSVSNNYAFTIGPGDVDFDFFPSGDEDSSSAFIHYPLFPAPLLPLNQWHHYAETYTGTNINAYVDGVFVGSSSATNPMVVLPNPVFIGFPDSGYDDGAVDDVRIYNRALSADEVAAVALDATQDSGWTFNGGTNLTSDGVITISSGPLLLPYLKVSLDPTMSGATLIGTGQLAGNYLYTLPQDSDQIAYDIYLQYADSSTNPVGRVIHKTIVFDRPRVVVSSHVLVVWNTNSAASSEVKDYYLANRPGFSNANVLAIGCLTNEQISLAECNDNITAPIVNWLTNNAAKPIRYLVFAGNVPTRVIDACPGGGCTNDVDTVIAYSLKRLGIRGGATFDASGVGGTSSIFSTNAYQRFSVSSFPGMTALITRLWMGSVDATTNYVHKLAVKYIGDVIISSGYTNHTYYFDGNPPGDVRGTIVADETLSARILCVPWLVMGTNVAGYYGGGVHQCTNSICRPNYYPLDGEIAFAGESDWYLIDTWESYNGMDRTDGDPTSQAYYGMWFSETAFGGTHYENTPIGAVAHCDEPGIGGLSSPDFFRMWERGWTFAEAAWISRVGGATVAFGDPLVRK